MGLAEASANTALKHARTNARIFTNVDVQASYHRRTPWPSMIFSRIPWECFTLNLRENCVVIQERSPLRANEKLAIFFFFLCTGTMLAFRPLDNRILLSDEEMKGVLDDGKGYPTSFEIQQKRFGKTLKVHMPTFRKSKIKIYRAV